MKQITYTDIRGMIEKNQCNPVFRGQYIALMNDGAYIAMDNSRGYMIISQFATKERAKRFLERIGEYKGGNRK